MWGAILVDRLLCRYRDVIVDIDGTCKAKVKYPRTIVVADDNVLRFEIAMDDSQGVCRLQWCVRLSLLLFGHGCLVGIWWLEFVQLFEH